LQRSAGRAVVPDSFTHGTSAQRQRWFGAGYQGGTIQSCDTFGARNL
jgi:predicted metalloprotease